MNWTDVQARLDALCARVSPVRICRVWSPVHGPEVAVGDGWGAPVERAESFAVLLSSGERVEP